MQLRPQAAPKKAATEQSAAADDEDYDDSQDHVRCADCKGSGYYVGLIERYHCPTCDGSGWR